MSNDAAPDPMGEPQPMSLEELARLTGKDSAPGANAEALAKAEADGDGLRGPNELMGPISMVIGGVIVFGVMAGICIPTVAGATRSAKLQWARRQVEIQKVITASESAMTGGPASGVKNSETNPSAE